MQALKLNSGTASDELDCLAVYHAERAMFDRAWVGWIGGGTGGWMGAVKWGTLK